MVVEQVPGGGVRHVGEPQPGAGEGIDGIRVERSPLSFEIAREHPHARPVYYRVDYGRLEWGFELDGFLPGPGGRPVPSHGALLSLLQGNAPAPDSSPVPGVQRLPVGTAVRVTEEGITVTRRRPVLPKPERGTGLAEAVATVLAGGDHAIAYSGGLGSAFLAACALSAGRRPLLLHADLGPEVLRTPAPDIPGLAVKRIPVDPSELLDEHPVTGAEPVPPMPDREVPRRLADALARAEGGEVPLAAGTLMKDLTSAKLSEVETGARGRRLLGCEPFHISGTLRTLGEARELLGLGRVHAPDTQDPGRDAAGASETDGDRLALPRGGSVVPGLTAEGAEVFESAFRASMAVWQEHLDFLDPVLGTAAAGIEERGDAGMRLPALDPRALAAVIALGPSGLGRIRRGVLERHLPLHRELDRHRITGVRNAAPGSWLRRAAAAHLHRERGKVIDRLRRECALADLGLVSPRAIIRTLSDGRDLADNALPLLRLVWLERWLGGGS
ncbi:hypothetical protein Acsp03_42670 [Actinomadura sp. NBRC 104412]|nr:hypothetical protein Acsp03_42670 [Actinomadura sp. NBRC 104412]